LKQKYKILFITYTHSNGGGAENVLTTLVNNLDPDHYAIDIIEVVQFLVRKEPLNKNIRLLSPMIKAENKIFESTIYHILYEKPEIIKPLFRLYGYDVIITWNYQLPSFCLRSFKNEIKIAWFHGAIYDFLPDAIDARPEHHKQLQLKTWETADRIVTISEKSLQSLKDIFPELAFKAEIIHNGFDFSKIQRLSIKNSEITIPTDIKNIIIGVGRFDKNKNFELLIRAVSRVIHSGTNCFLIILGHGELLSALEEIAVKEKIKDFVLFAGYQQNPYPYFKLSKIVCLTSFSEGWPTVIIEGMFLGKPFVTTPVAGASEELSDNGKCGLVSDWNIEEYAACIRKLLTDQNLYNKMSENCKEKVKQFSVENTTVQFDVLIEKLYDTYVLNKKKQSKNDRIQAIYHFACIYSSINIKDTQLLFAYNRYKNNKSLINIIKLIYRLTLTIINCFLFPFRFCTGFVSGCFLGV